MAVSPLIGAAVAGLFTVAVTPVTARVALRLGVVDLPGHLKPHAAPVPYLGGVAIFLGVAVAAAVGAGSWPALIALGAALLVGLVDDVRTLPPLVRLVAEAGIGGLVAANLSVEGWPLVLVTVVGTVACLNAVNFVDGIDGLATATTALSCGTMALLLDAPWDAVAAAVAAASLGFLVFNRPPARIYLGDAGSYLLGTATVLCLTALAQGAEPGVPSLGVAGILLGFAFLPFVELSSTVLRRLASGRSPLEGDRAHLYDRLMDRWQSRPRVLGVLLAAQAGAVAAAVVAQRADGLLPGLLVGTAVVAATLLVAATAVRESRGAPDPA